MHYVEGNSIDLTELAKEKFLDTAHSKVFCYAQAVSKESWVCPVQEVENFLLVW